MRVVRAGEDPTGAPELAAGSVATIGNYDGIHRGQRAVLERVVARAREIGLAAAAVTFEPHPLDVLAPGRAPLRIASDAQRERLLAALGVDLLWILRFDSALAALPAEEFCRDHLARRLGAREVHVGSRFAFGRGRSGDLALLRRLGPELGFEAVGVPEIELDGAPVSSTRIREALAAGRVELAAELLGRPFARGGRIREGHRLGHRIGFPTANLEADAPLLPANGVYAAKLRRAGGEGELAGAANVGVRPTVDGATEPRIEIHLFDFDEELYGEEVEISFWSRIRDERRFDGLEALRAQIARDVEVAREYFASVER